jgi:archaellum component FlaC
MTKVSASATATQKLQTQKMEIDFELQKISMGIDDVKEKQDEMANDVKKIKDAVYHPDQGIYSRLKEIETWKKTIQKAMWMVASTTIGLVIVTIWKLITTK